MVVFHNTCIILTFLISVIILESDTKRPNIRDDPLTVKRDYRPSKWVANSAMDVWYGNKSLVDVISREFSDVMLRLTARQARSTLKYLKIEPEKEIKYAKEKPNLISRVEINFVNEDNVTVHTIELRPMLPRPPKRPYKQSLVTLLKG